jgi:EAL domain-containing protein (putative c-di-GMP-specific phosphodiesterase class I)
MALGCDAVQGFLVGRPQPAGRFLSQPARGDPAVRDLAARAGA